MNKFSFLFFAHHVTKKDGEKEKSTWSSQMRRSAPIAKPTKSFSNVMMNINKSSQEQLKEKIKRKKENKE